MDHLIFRFEDFFNFSESEAPAVSLMSPFSFTNFEAQTSCCCLSSSDLGSEIQKKLLMKRLFAILVKRLEVLEIRSRGGKKRFLPEKENLSLKSDQDQFLTDYFEKYFYDQAILVRQLIKFKRKIKWINLFTGKTLIRKFICNVLLKFRLNFVFIILLI